MRTRNEAAAFWMPFIRNCTLSFSCKASQSQKHLNPMFLQDELMWLLAFHKKEMKSCTKSYKTNNSLWQCSGWFIEESYCNGLSTSGQGGFLYGQLVCNYLIGVFSFIYKAKVFVKPRKPELITLFCQQRIIRLQQKLRCQLLCYLSRFLSYFWIYYHIHSTQNHSRLLLQLVHLPMITLVAWGISFGSTNLTLQMSRQPTWHVPTTAAEQLSQSDPSLVHWI